MAAPPSLRAAPGAGPAGPVEPAGAMRIALWILGPLLAVVAYFYGLDSIHIPGIGDEALYTQIARVTAASGRWLPLRWEHGINDTKPPMLFWQAIVTTARGTHFNHWTLRGPIVLYSLAVALLAGLLAWRLSGRRATGLLAGMIYLGFLSTVQQGRPFLINAPETFFLFAPLVLVMLAPRLDGRAVLACGLCLGMAALYKSFFLVAAGTAGIGCVLFRRSDLDPGRWLGRYGAFCLAIALIGLAVFSLWLALDPHPELVVRQFVGHENAGKFRAEGFVGGLFTGRYTIFRIWLGDFANAGLYAVLLAGFLVLTLRTRASLTLPEREIWWYVLAFLVVYSFPAQRQENYILPTCAALAVLMALRWQAIGPAWFVVSHALVGVVLLLSLGVRLRIEQLAGARLFTALDYGSVALGLLLVATGLARGPWRRELFPLAVFVVLLSESLFLQPFSRHFSAATCARLDGATVYFPSTSVESQEKYRFVLPGARVAGYVGSPLPWLTESTFVAIRVPYGHPLPGGVRPIEEIRSLRTRHSPREIRDMVLRGRLDLLADRLVIVEPARGAKAAAER